MRSPSPALAARGLALSLLLSSTAMAGVVGPTVFEVDSTSDTVDRNPGDGVCADITGACSLRAAVMEANALGSPTEIRLGPENAFALTLIGAGEDAAATGDLDVTGQIQLNGNESTLDGLGLDRFFDVQPGGRLSVNRLYASNGGVVDESGGGYRNRGQLGLLYSIVDNSSATGAGASGGAVFNDGGILLVLTCLFENNDATRAGGAIESNGGNTTILRSLILTNSTGPGPGNGGGFHLTGMGNVEMRRTLYSGNSASAEGGGVWNSSAGTLHLELCRFVGNSANGIAADNGGGGVFNDGGVLSLNGGIFNGNSANLGSGSGGGLFNNAGDVTAVGTSFRNNVSARAGGGIEVVGGSTLLTSVLIDGNMTGDMPGNGGGLHLTGMGDVTIADSTVNGNSAGSEGGGLWNSAVGSMTVSGTGVTQNAANGIAADNGGGGLFNDGGTLSVTGGVISGNTALMGSGSGGGILNNLGTLSVDGTLISGNMSARAGGGIEAVDGSTSLMGALLSANMAGPSPGNGGGLHISGAGSVALVDTDVVLNSAAAEGGGLWNSAGSTMDIIGCSVDGNIASGNDPDQGGGGLFNEGGTMVVDDTAVTNNVADGTSGSGGGALNNSGGSLDITDATFAGNASQRAGGGIEANASPVTMDQVALAFNTTGPAPGNGGGLHLTGAATIDFVRSVAVGNSASAEGGGLWNSALGTLNVSDARIDGNTASGDLADQGGGGLFNEGGGLNVLDTILNGNAADGVAGSGGGILNMNGSLQVQVSTISDNSSNRAGGGVEQTGLDAMGNPVTSQGVFVGVTFEGNATGAAPGNGGAFHQTGPGDAAFVQCFVSDNTAGAEGGGLWNSAVASMQVFDCLIEGNVASGNDPDQGGGGIFGDGGQIVITGSTISGNVANGSSGSGGGVLNNMGMLTLTSTTLSGNSSMRAGGGIEANVGTTDLNDVVLSDNVTGAAPGNGGGLHLTGAGSVTYDDGLCTLNDAANEGGGLWNSDTGTMIVNNVSIQTNTAPVGTDVFNDGGTFTIDGNNVPPGP